VTLFLFPQVNLALNEGDFMISAILKNICRGLTGGCRQMLLTVAHCWAHCVKWWGDYFEGDSME